MKPENIYDILHSVSKRDIKDYKPLLPVFPYAKEHYPEEYDKFIRFLTNVRLQVADDIERAAAERRQTKINFDNA